jgi:hypothetical protein
MVKRGKWTRWVLKVSAAVVLCVGLASSHAFADSMILPVAPAPLHSAFHSSWVGMVISS